MYYSAVMPGGLMCRLTHRGFSLAFLSWCKCNWPLTVKTRGCLCSSKCGTSVIYCLQLDNVDLWLSQPFLLDWQSMKLSFLLPSTYTSTSSPFLARMLTHDFHTSLPPPSFLHFHHRGCAGVFLLLRSKRFHSSVCFFCTDCAAWSCHVLFLKKTF